MVFQKLRVSQNFSQISRVSQSRFLYEGVSESQNTLNSRFLQSKKSKSLRLAKKSASLAVLQSLAFTIRHPYNRPTNNCMLLSNMGFLLSCLI